MKTVSIIAIFALFFYSTEKPQITTKTDRKTIIMPSVMPNTTSDYIDYCSEKYSIPKAVIVGIGIAETGFGKDGVGVAPINNIFGIKKGDGWKGQTYRKCDECSIWRKYDSKFESIEDFCKFIRLHYSHLIGRKIKDWRIYNYGNSRYEKTGFFNQFETE